MYVRTDARVPRYITEGRGRKVTPAVVQGGRKRKRDKKGAKIKPVNIRDKGESLGEKRRTEKANVYGDNPRRRQYCFEI